MSHPADIKTVLAADGALTALLTGGVYTRAELGRMGLSRQSASDAYDSDLKLKPCAVIRQRSAVPDGAIVDEALQVASYRPVVEIYLYSDGSSTPPESAANRIYTLVQNQSIGNFRWQWSNQLEDWHDPALDNANMIRIDFEGAGRRG